ncbi:MAG: AbrB/MazE/SpoVT family DNA-binding domain-containing protein [Candidatus Woesearchaeota archaeon]
MQRKVIQLAGKTLVVSLPNKWVKQFGIQKGDELDILEEDNQLVIRSGIRREESKNIFIDISDSKERIIRWTLSALHKKGYDEIQVKFEHMDKLRILEDLIRNRFIGFAIVHQTESLCIIRNITKEAEMEFDSILRRGFLVTESLAESTLDLMKRKKFKEMSELVQLEKTNNQLTNFCERIINKGKYPVAKDSHFMYVIAWNLEKVADDYKYICEYLSRLDNPVIDQPTVEIFERINHYFKEFYYLFYKFKIEELNELDKKRKIIIKDIIEVCEHANKENTVILNYLLSNIYKIVDFHASTIALNSEPED